MPESTENKVVPISGLVHEWFKTVAAQLANFSATKEKKDGSWKDVADQQRENCCFQLLWNTKP